MKMPMMKIERPALLHGFTFLVVVALFSVLSAVLPETSFIYGFMFRCWPIQFLTSWLFIMGILYWIQRYRLIKREEEVLQKLNLPNYTIDRHDVWQLINEMPEEYKKTLTFRRLKELLQAFVYGEDLIRLNEELSRRDSANVEKGHLMLNSIRTIVPIIGFLGTVIGLSLGIVELPYTSDITVLRTALKSFAASLSVAFDTTLLALSYTVGIALLITYLRDREESLVGQVDENARTLLDKIKQEENYKMFQSKNNDIVSIQYTDLTKEIGKAIRENFEVVIQKLEDLKKDS